MCIDLLHALCFDETCICGGYGRVTQHSVQGRGLGLGLVYGRVTQHSVPGRGLVYGRVTQHSVPGRARARAGARASISQGNSAQ